MKTGFYPKLAWDGIRKNKRLYIPYILTGCMMVMMYYILSFLRNSPALAYMKGGSVLMTMLPLGYGVITVFSVLFLFYTNSFLIKQRYREFGLYNMLGMDKKNICRIMLWENFFVAAAAIGAGLAMGILLSKAAELVLFNLLNMEVNYKLSIGMQSLCEAPVIYGMIYLLLLLNSVIRVACSKPLELMQSSKVGEKIPKRTWIFAVAGAVLLIVAYYLAVSMEEPLEAMVWFFVAVILVIIGTYLLFIAGSVVFCRILQKNKRYYYQPNHFVSVSSMVYRMKRNGAGLASICILLTMVLVMISSSASLYFGFEDSLRAKCPSGVNFTVTFDEIDGISNENLDSLRSVIQQYSKEGVDLTGIRAAEVPGVITEEGITIDFEKHGAWISSYGNMGYISVISLDDYNAMMGEAKTLEDKECLLYCDRLDFSWDTFTMEYGETYQVKERLKEFQVDADSLALLVPTVHLVVRDIEAFAAPVAELKNSAGEAMMTYDWRGGFDMDTSEAEIQTALEISRAFKELEEEKGLLYHGANSREAQREGFYDMYGSLFFLGIMLSIVFLMAAVLIIYYKQICEGYEDQARFEIMQKVGMTKRDIKKSINSQMLTVFFMPLMFAGIHLAFAFPFIIKILKLFSFHNTLLCIGVTLGCFIVFGILYTVVYKITSGAYYTIVSGRKEAVR